MTKEELNKVGKAYMWTLIGLILFGSGMVMNIKVVNANDCRMPVKNWVWGDSDKHFSY